MTAEPLPPWPERIEIRRPDAIDLLTGPKSLRILRPFLLGVHTLTSAARELERPVNTVAYWLPRFLAAGLVERIDTVHRSGAPMPRYRATAQQFTVPVGALPVDGRIALLDRGRLRLLDRFLDGLDEAIERDGDVSLGFRAGTEAGTMAVEMVEDETRRNARAYTDGWNVLSLDHDDALALSRELEELMARYSDRRGRRRYIVHAGLVAEPKIGWRSVDR